MATSVPAEQQMALEDEAPVRLRRRRREDAEMDITPMIDITFLLLIFFLVASRMDQAAMVSLPPAKYGTAVASKNAVVLVVRDSGSENALVTRGDGTSFATDLAQQEAEIAEYVEAGLTGSPPFDAVKEHILIRAERKVKHREVARVAQAVGQGSQGHQLHIAVLETR